MVERVTTSIWPGTTLSLLKFPMMTPTARRLEMRRRRLLYHKSWAQKEEHFQIKLFHETKDPRYLALTGNVESTFRDEELQHQILTREEIDKKISGATTEDLEGEIIEKLSRDKQIFLANNYCFDTPGTVNTDQVILNC